MPNSGYLSACELDLSSCETAQVVVYWELGESRSVPPVGIKRQTKLFSRSLISFNGVSGIQRACTNHLRLLHFV